jgi:hypothetical protein
MLKAMAKAPQFSELHKIEEKLLVARLQATRSAIASNLLAVKGLSKSRPTRSDRAMTVFLAVVPNAAELSW